MNYSVNTGMIVLLALLAGACAQSGKTVSTQPQVPDGSATYRWSSFFNDGCGKRMRVRLKSRNDGVLAYGCTGGDKRQNLQRHQDEGKVQFWVADRLVDEELYRLSNAKCQATIVVLGSDYATIHYRCALVQLTVVYALEERWDREDTLTELRLQPRRVLVTYGDGTQKFNVRQDVLVPAEPFKPFGAEPEPGQSL